MSSSYYRMCRLCACEEPKVSVNMFSEVGKRHQLPDKIRLCLPITIDEDDRLPKEICTSCLYKLEMCNELYNTSFTAQNILKSKLENIIYEQPQFLEDNSHRVNGVSQKRNAESQVKTKLSSQNSGDRKSLKNVQQESESDETDIAKLHEQQNSSVISQDIVVRLTTVESRSLNRPSVTNVFSYEKPVDMQTDLPGIIVTDLTGAPLGQLEPEEEEEEQGILASEPLDSNLLDAADVTMEQPNSSRRVAEKKDKGGGGGSETNHDSSTETDEETQVQKKEKSSPKVKLKPDLKKKSSGSHNVKCRYCSKWFSKSIIDHHQRLHLNERVYSCVDCGKNFSTESSLSSHSCEPS